MPDDDQSLAVAEGGPMDGEVLGPAEVDRYEVRMADESLHLYIRSVRAVPQGLAFYYAGRRGSGTS